MKFRVIIEQDEDGVFVARYPALPVCISQGTTREEAQANIKEAITGYLASLKKHGEPGEAEPTEEEVAAIARGKKEIARGEVVSWRDIKIDLNL